MSLNASAKLSFGDCLEHALVSVRNEVPAVTLGVVLGEQACTYVPDRPARNTSMIMRTLLFCCGSTQTT